MDFPVESYSFLPGSRAILDLSYRSRLRNSNYTMSQQSRPTISMILADLTVSKRPGTSYQIEIHFAVVNHLYRLFSFVKLVETL